MTFIFSASADGVIANPLDALKGIDNADPDFDEPILVSPDGKLRATPHLPAVPTARAPLPSELNPFADVDADVKVPPGLQRKTLSDLEKLPDAETSAAVDAQGRVSRTTATRTDSDKRLIDSLTSEDTQVTVDANGSSQAEISLGPSRVKDGNGRWRTLDGTLETKSNGRIGAKVGAVDVSFSPSAVGDLVVTNSDAGPFAVSHVGALPVLAEVAANQVSYRNALPGRTIVEQPFG